MALNPDAPDVIYHQFVNHGPAIQAALIHSATDLFAGLAVIEFVWMVGWSLANKSDVFDIMIVVTKQMIALGFWFWIMQNWVQMAKAITDTFGIWGNTAIVAAGGTANMSPMGFVTAGLNLAHTIWDAVGIGHPLVMGILAVVGLIDVLIFAWIASLIMLVVIEAFLASYLGTVLMAFAGSSWTRDYGVSQFRYAVSVGVKRMTLQLIAGIGEIIVNDWATQIRAVNGNIGWGDCGVMLVVPVILATLAWIAPKIAQDMVMGTHLSTSQGILATARNLGSAAAMIATGGAGYAAAGAAAGGLAAKQAASAGASAAAAGGGAAGGGSAISRAASVARLTAGNVASGIASDIGQRLSGGHSHGYQGFRVASQLNAQAENSERPGTPGKANARSMKKPD